MEQTQTAPLRDLVKGALGGEQGTFRPCAYFDEPLDCIRVITRDCSVTETRVNPRLTVLEDNYADPSAGRELYVGFTIKGAKHFCQQHGIDLSVPVRFSELLDRILAESSDPFVRMAVCEVAKPLIQSKNIVEVSLAAAA